MNITKSSLTLAILFLAACADPADNVPAASVSTNGASATTSQASATPIAAAKAYVINAENSKVE
ncbi:MAG: hypothetical protein ACXW3Z_16865, partial [Limisphaerales bacterium]